METKIILGIFENQNILFSNFPVSSLLYNAIHGFSLLGSDYFNEKLKSISLGHNRVEIKQVDGCICFIMGRQIKDVTGALERMAEYYSLYKENNDYDCLRESIIAVGIDCDPGNK